MKTKSVYNSRQKMSRVLLIQGYLNYTYLQVCFFYLHLNFFKASSIQIEEKTDEKVICGIYLFRLERLLCSGRLLLRRSICRIRWVCRAGIFDDLYFKRTVGGVC